ncbi:MAG: aminotransferase class V-fold PLP-dependent enzyme [Acidobacteria bacterium]|nr:aminotransferase class V-fold PLP-dependent enzyme [Acidobacteriota bacterium]
MNRRELFPIFGALALRANAQQQVRLAANSLAAAGASAQKAARDEDFWFQVRHAFTVERNFLNFNNGSLCPAPKLVQEAADRYWTITNMHPSMYVDELLISQTEPVRQELAHEFGCSPEELALTRNTSEGLHNVIYGIPLKAGDEVLTTTQDYPSMITSLRQRERRDGIVLKQFAYPTPPREPAELTELFVRHITPKTRAILVSHLTFTTGQIFPIAEICREARRRGIISIVDGAHGFAHLDFKVKDVDCDFYSTSLHKWLFAPVGTGFLYVRREWIPRVWPLMGAPESLSNDIRKFESVGTQPMAMRTAIGEALAFHHSIGAERKWARLCYLRERWEDPLRANPRVILRNANDPRQSAGIGAVTVKGVEGPKLGEILEKKYRIHTRARVIPGEFECIRVSPNLYTAVDEIDRFSAAIEEIARTA